MSHVETKFLAVTYEFTAEHAAEAIAAAGGRGTQEEMAEVTQQSTFRQRVHVQNVTEHISAMWNQGYRVVNVQPTVPPIA